MLHKNLLKIKNNGQLNIHTDSADKKNLQTLVQMKFHNSGNLH